MATIDLVHGERFGRMMNETLVTEVKRRLKEPLMKIAEAEVDAAVDEAVAELNIRAESYRDIQWMRQVVEFIVTRPERPA